MACHPTRIAGDERLQAMSYGVQVDGRQVELDPGLRANADTVQLRTPGRLREVGGLGHPCEGEDRIPAGHVDPPVPAPPEICLQDRVRTAFLEAEELDLLALDQADQSGRVHQPARASIERQYPEPCPRGRRGPEPAERQ